MIKNKKGYVADQAAGKAEEKRSGKILISNNGPYIVSGGLPLAKEYIVTDDDGISTEWKKGESYPEQDTYALCRCGGSKSKPYCDGTHVNESFDGTETATKKKYMARAERIEGPGFTLTDVQDLCAVARFCHQAGGIWRLTAESDDPNDKKVAARIAGQCSSGRLVIWDNETGKPIEPEFEPSVSLTEDQEKECSGPLWVKGGVPIESENGTKYEVRNRVTLCRCGQSENKPYCDGTHISCHFNDGDPEL
ncbi:conserved hypothetical protein [Methanocella paludicola SANAE]|uniref:Iron-binding zinc finger CDGSH type domain-containing protein n=1 Tax=Methanocella paludicola (strain DSM 17711 / JCM 13418 / NBRC 101707 / SANAE) TaxID=304371 RepID=D1Z0I9_METPS|nr:CDGSH iron-sulfur domain-containing protein [Methanocella paludicola]BAI62211.1 conserved hypothetical protein [Methanocella paludicola SANAE]